MFQFFVYLGSTSNNTVHEGNNYIFWCNVLTCCFLLECVHIKSKLKCILMSFYVYVRKELESGRKTYSKNVLNKKIYMVTHTHLDFFKSFYSLLFPPMWEILNLFLGMSAQKLSFSNHIFFLCFFCLRYSTRVLPRNV